MKYRSWFRVTLLVLAATLAQVVAAGQSSPPVPGKGPVTLTLSSGDTNFKIGAPMMITITMTNNGKSDFVWESERPEPAYRNFKFLLTASGGDEIPKSLYHRKITGRQLPSDPADVATGSSMVATLAPGQSVRFTVDLTKLYQIERPGTYTLVVEKREDQFNERKLRSKPFECDVVP